MKLRNKKTGAIYNIEDIDLGNNQDGIWLGLTTYTSLADLNKDWEDYEDNPCVIDMWEDDCICDVEDGIRMVGVERAKECGLYFKTKEEAEKAVEKLKAWKLLKDECNIKFNGLIINDKGILEGVKLIYNRHDRDNVTYDRMKESMEALNLLFGGEE